MSFKPDELLATLNKQGVAKASHFEVQIDNPAAFVAEDNRYDEDTRLKISYRVLNGASKYKYFKPCVKHYLTPHVKSRFLEVYAAEWDIALFLPTERFVGAGKGKVQADSRKMI